MDDQDLEQAMEQFASDVAEALGYALTTADKEWRPLPFLPLTIGLDRYNGDVDRQKWWAWVIKFTWVRKDT